MRRELCTRRQETAGSKGCEKVEPGRIVNTLIVMFCYGLQLQKQGLLKIGEEGVTVVVTHVNGDKIRFSEDVAASLDGKVYFSLGNTRFDFHHWHLDILEPASTGQLVQFDPSTGTAPILLDHLGLANGVVLSKNQDYLVVCETWKFRCLKYVLKGEDAGKTEIFIHNIPGAPDNINLAPDGSFWITLLQISPSRWLRYVTKSVVEAFPKDGVGNRH